MEQTLASLGYSFVAAIGEDPKSQWPSELSVLALGILRADAQQIGKEYVQAAIVWAGADALLTLLELEPAPTVNGDFQVLLVGEFSTMVSSWNESLCMERRDGKIYLSSRGYAALAKLSEYEIEDEDGEVDHVLPATIDGQEVIGTEDEYVVGGPLVPCDDEAEITLSRGEVEEAQAWLSNREWDGQPGFEEAWCKILKALQ